MGFQEDATDPEQKPLIKKPMDKRLSEGVSTGLDIFKGIFVLFMLTEHARAGIGADKHASSSLWFVNNVAHTMDMICYSFAYGYSSYRSYLSDLVARTPAERWARGARSAGLVWGAGVLADVCFAWILDGRPSMETVLELVTGWQVYWDFLRTFPVMLLVMTLCIPIISTAYSGPSRPARLAAASSLVLAPLAASFVHLPLQCDVGPARFAPFLVSCKHASIRSSRFPALPQLVNFNAGVLTAMWMRRVETAWSPGTEAARVRSSLLELSVVVGATAACSMLFAVRLLSYWQDHDMEEPDMGVGLMHFTRFPPSAAWLLGCMGLGFALFITTTGLGVCLVDSQKNFFARLTSGYFEHLGANVLLYLVLSNIVIQATGGFHGFLGEHFLFGEKTKENEAMAPFIRCGLMLVFIGFIHYLVKGSRK